MKKNKRYDIFISYRRNGGEFTAKILRDRLEELGYRVFFDVETLRSGDFNKRLYSVIDECKDFLLVLSPNALDRCVNEDDWVRYEVERALLKDKNIIPIMLRGFEFPETLPETIEPVRFKSGLEANSQFFDAFIGKLQEYLLSEPFKRRIPVAAAAAAAALAVLAVGAGIFFLRRSGNDVFPRTGTEKAVTEEAVYYVQSNLTVLDEMLSTADDALEAARRYLTSGSSAFSALDSSFDVALEALNGFDLDSCAPSYDFINRIGALDDAPFSVADLIAMHDVAVATQTEWTGNLSFVLWAMDPDSYLPADTRLADLDYLQQYLEEDMKLNAYNVNEMLLPITDRSFLDDFFNEYLPTLKSIPLAASSWSTEKEALRADQERCANRQDQIILEYSTLVGNMSMDNAALRESLIRTYEAMGFTRAEAEQQVELWMEHIGLMAETDETLQQQQTETEDSWDTLWLDLQDLMGAGEYSYALECVDQLDKLMAGDADAALYLPALRRFIESVESTGVDYGAMVMAWYDPEQPSEIFRIGDVIIAVNGEPCRTIQEYNELKAALDGKAFTVTVLRDDGQGTLAPVELAADTDMPMVWLNDLTSPAGEP